MYTYLKDSSLATYLSPVTPDLPLCSSSVCECSIVSKDLQLHPVSTTLSSANTKGQRPDQYRETSMSQQDPFQALVDALRRTLTINPPTPSTSASPSPAPAVTSVNTVPSSSPPVYASPMATPAPYAGSAEDCSGFLLQCELVLEMQPHLYPNDTAKIAFLISQLRGKALKWADSIWSQHGAITQSYSSFTSHFREVFGKPISDSSAVTDRPMPAVTPEVPSSSTTPSPNVATVASSMPLRASSHVTPCVVSKPEPEPEPSSSAMDTTFSPVSIRPHPKAGPRKQTTKGRKRRETAVLTNTPVKKQLEAEKSRSAAKRKIHFSNNKKSKPKKIQDSSDDENEFCIVCLESFSRSREVWLQCWSCKAWAHKDCTDGRDFYTCHNCDSD
ncbi:Retrotransposon Gag-like protein 6 [Anabarilius grahami]|uniref:Retrotransposon Gag-like protein 6 n=1 Tax=Anabarilius grahami TaxID=495550 RepID=A0A3N0XRB8_ANAGA|nr:Retrotransposon Gag-like protein 6 [Anabarilius grahami]